MKHTILSHEQFSNSVRNRLTDMLTPRYGKMVRVRENPGMATVWATVELAFGKRFEIDVNADILKSMQSKTPNVQATLQLPGGYFAPQDASVVSDVIRDLSSVCSILLAEYADVIVHYKDATKAEIEDAES